MQNSLKYMLMQFKSGKNTERIKHHKPWFNIRAQRENTRVKAHVLHTAILVSIPGTSRRVS